MIALAGSMGTISLMRNSLEFIWLQKQSDVLLRLNLSLSNCHGQCYDGASNMSGKRSGVATQLRKEEPRALYTHCYGHALNLAAADRIFYFVML